MVDKGEFGKEGEYGKEGEAEPVKKHPSQKGVLKGEDAAKAKAEIEKQIADKKKPDSEESDPDVDVEEK